MHRRLASARSLAALAALGALAAAGSAAATTIGPGGPTFEPPTDLFATDFAVGAGGDASMLSGINDARLAIGSEVDGGGTPRAILCDLATGATTDIDARMPAPTSGSIGRGLNGTGLGVGYYYDGTTGARHAFSIATGGTATATDLDPAIAAFEPTLVEAVADGVNDAGEVVGAWFDGARTGRAFALSGGAFADIDAAVVGALPAAIETYAYDVNAAGVVVGSWRDSSTGNIRGFLFDPAAGVTDLSSLFPSSLAVWPTGINAGGWIVGTATDATGTVQTGFLIDPALVAASAVPYVSGATSGSARGVNGRLEIVGASPDDFADDFDDTSHAMLTHATVEVAPATYDLEVDAGSFVEQNPDGLYAFDTSETASTHQLVISKPADDPAGTVVDPDGNAYAAYALGAPLHGDFLVTVDFDNSSLLVPANPDTFNGTFLEVVDGATRIPYVMLASESTTGSAPSPASGFFSFATGLFSGPLGAYRASGTYAIRRVGTTLAGGFMDGGAFEPVGDPIAVSGFDMTTNFGDFQVFYPGVGPRPLDALTGSFDDLTVAPPPVVAPAGDVTSDVPPANGVTVGFLNVGESVTGPGAGSLVVSGGGGLFGHPGFAWDVGGPAGSSGELVVTDAGTLVNAAGGLLVGRGYTTSTVPGSLAPGSDGIVRVLGGATLTAGSIHLGESWDDPSFNGSGALNGRGTGTLVVDGAGSNVEVAQDLSSFLGRGEVTVSSGASLEAGFLDGGGGPSGDLEVTVTGAGSSLTVDGQGNATLGGQGTGALDVLAGASATLEGGAVFGGAFPTPGTGSLAIDGAGSKVLAGGGSGNAIYFGNAGNGALAGASGAGTISSGGLLELTDRVAPGAPPEGPGGVFQHAQLIVGFGGEGTLDVLSGSRLFVHDRGIVPKRAEIFAGAIFNAQATPCSGSLTIDGAGTTCEIDGSTAAFTIGEHATGSVAITNGSAMTMDGRDVQAFVNLADGTGGIGAASATLVLSGTLSLTTTAAQGNNSNVAVGINGGSASVTIEKGGLLSVRGVQLGTGFTNPVASPGTGEMHVLAGGELSLSGWYVPSNFTAFLSVGNIGTGRLTVESDGVNGGLVTVDGGGATFPGIWVGNAQAGGASTGELDVIGPGARIQFFSQTESSILLLGNLVGANASTGTMRVAGGAVLSGLQSVQIGRGGTASATIDGGGTEVLLTAVQTNTVGVTATPGQAPSFLVGRAGTGSLVLSDGAQILIHPDRPITSASFRGGFTLGGARPAPGLLNGGTGNVTMTAGALVEVGGEFGAAIVGRDGHATLDMSGGSIVRVLNPDGNGFGAVALLPGSTGALSVSGPGTLFDGGSSLGIGVQVTNTAFPAGGTGVVTLADGGTIGGATVRVGGPGTLVGSGNVAGDLVVAGGLVAPGASAGAIGAIAVSGGVTLTAGTIDLDVEGTAPGTFDAITAGGPVALLGGTLAVHYGGGYTPAIGDSVTVISGASVTLTGAALSVTGAPGGGVARLVADASGLHVQFVALLPGAPSGLAATVLSQTSVGLAWTDNASTETGFVVERSPSGLGTFGAIGTTAANVTAFTDTTGLAATAYDYRVKATNTGGDSGYSNVASATTLPDAPLDPGALLASASSQTAAFISWLDNSSNEDGFEVERAIAGSGNFTLVVTASANATDYTDASLAAASSYDYRVRAVNAGGASGYTNIATVTTPPDAPAAPSGLAATALSRTVVSLSWTDNAIDETGFVIERRPSGSGAFGQVGVATANTTSFADTTASAGTAYDYEVFATNAGGDSADSNVATVTTVPDAPLAPVNVSATAVSATAVTVTWSDPAGDETGFLVQRSASGAGSFLTIATVGGSVFALTDGTAAADTSYDYRVVATNAGGDSPASIAATTSTPIETASTGKLVYTPRGGCAIGPAGGDAGDAAGALLPLAALLLGLALGRRRRARVTSATA